MHIQISRRQAVVRSAQAGALALAAGVPSGAGVAAVQPAATSTGSGEPWPGFPQQQASLVREVVGASHRNEARVREIIGQHPSLVNACWDWGFGDFETPLGAASHTGRREIAEFLLEQGARIDIFAATMLGYVDVVKALVVARPGIQKTRGPHGIHLLNHAKAGGEASEAMVKYLEELGGAGEPLPSSPLSAEQRQVYIGEYSFGTGASDRLVVTVDKEELWVTRDVESKRRLTYIGEDSFYPSGSPAVRLKFAVEGGKASSVTVVDGGPVVVATRIG